MQRDNVPYRFLEEWLGSRCADQALTRGIVSLFGVRRYRKGDCFSTEGEETDKLGLIVDGVFSMYTVREDGKLFVKDFPTKAQFLLASFEAQQPALVSIRSLTDATVVEARYSAVCSIIEGHPELERAARRGAERRMEELHRRLESFGTTEAGERYRSFKRDFGDLEEFIPQYLIASYLGVTPTQLSRIRKQGKTQHM